jgi:SAM-dependent methyltransferase
MVPRPVRPALPPAASRLLPLRTLPFRAADLLGTRASRAGDRRGWDWLVYNPLTMWSYHRLARREAGPVIAALNRVFPEAGTYLDVGAGSGAYAAAARRRGLRVLALERSRAGRALAAAQRVRPAAFDLRTAQPGDRRADLAYCFEVAEHLPRELGDRLVPFLAGAAPIVVFTAAQPGQGGYGHINEQPVAYWAERFRAAGMEPAPEESDALRRAFAEHGVGAPWFFENLAVYRRSPTTGSRPGA